MEDIRDKKESASGWNILQVNKGTATRRLDDAQPASCKIGQWRCKREGSRIVSDDPFDAATLVPLIDIHAGKPEELAILVDGIGDIVGFASSAGTFNCSDSSQKPISSASKGG
jgi:hypothetical protein